MKDWIKTKMAVDNPDIEVVKIIISILGFGGTISALAFGLRQYWRAEQWKKSEFVAKEIKEFDNDPYVRNTKAMIDWGDREINLFLKDDPKATDFRFVTRKDQYTALVPHIIKSKYPHSSVKANKTGKMQFTLEEAKIRDTFDVFLDHLGRFGNFIQAELVTEKEFEPYLFYWLQSMTKVANPENIKVKAGNVEEIERNCEEDNKWRIALLTYINYYNFDGVKYLFAKNGFEIDPDQKHSVFDGLGEMVKDKKFYNDLLETIKK